jgi:protein TonB
VRLDSPVVLATAGTLAIHLILAIAGDAVVVLNPIRPPEPAPKVALVDIEVEKPKPPPPPDKEEPPPEDTPKQVVPQTVQPKAQPRRVATAQPPPNHEPPPPPSDTPPSGGAPVMTIDVNANAVGTVPVAGGKPVTAARYGKGGTGTGTGTGSGAGSSDVPPPVSIATIKQRALPKGDFSYFDASKDYPAEAKSLGIEGTIRVRLVVDENGKVKDTRLLNRLGHGLDELALERAKKIEFEPARDTDDKAVSSVVVWTFNMTLPK